MNYIYYAIRSFYRTTTTLSDALSLCYIHCPHSLDGSSPSIFSPESFSARFLTVLAHSANSTSRSAVACSSGLDKLTPSHHQVLCRNHDLKRPIKLSDLTHELHYEHMSTVDLSCGFLSLVKPEK